MENLKRVYTVDTSKFSRSASSAAARTTSSGASCPATSICSARPKAAPCYLLGTDRLGRDVLSRIIYGARISLTIGLLGIAISFVLGIVIGGLAGYYGGWVDLVVQRIIEVMQSLPTIPLWLALAAIMPVTLGPDPRLFRHHGHPRPAGLDAAGARGALQAAVAARGGLRPRRPAHGRSPARIIGRHLMPGFMSHLIASATITIPTMILGETALSFLGLGLRPPVTSWGVLLNEAQNINVVALYPWLMLPVVPVILVILAFNFLGDGLRDAADPYA